MAEVEENHTIIGGSVEEGLWETVRFRRGRRPHDGTGVFIRRGRHTRAAPLHYVRTSEMAFCHLGRVSSPVLDRAGDTTSDSQPPRQWEINVCGVSLPVYGVVIMARAKTVLNLGFSKRKTAFLDFTDNYIQRKINFFQVANTPQVYQFNFPLKE